MSSPFPEAGQETPVKAAPGSHTSLCCNVGCKAPFAPGSSTEGQAQPGQWGSQSPLCTDKGLRGALLCPLSSTPGQAAAVNETPSPLALALSLPNAEQLLEGCTRDQKKTQKPNPRFG